MMKKVIFIISLMLITCVSMFACVKSPVKLTIYAADVQMEIGQTVKISATTGESKYDDYLIYEVYEGVDVIEIEDNHVTAKTLGYARIKVSNNAPNTECEDVIINVAVGKVNCTITPESTNVDLVISDRFEIKATVDVTYPFDFLYTIIEGNDVISLDNNVVIANAIGSAKVKIGMLNSDDYAIVNFTVSYVPYEINVPSTITIERDYSQKLEYEITSSHPNFINNKQVNIQVISGDDNINFDPETNMIKGLVVGTSQIQLSVQNEEIKVVTITISPAQYEIFAEETITVNKYDQYTINAEIIPNIDGKIIKYEVVEGAEFVTVNKTLGTVTGKAVGVAKIKVYADPERVTYVSVTVNKPVATITVDDEISVFQTESAILEYFVQPSGTQLDFTLIDNDNNVFTFNEGNNTVNGINVGVAQLKIYMVENPDIYKIVTVTVESLYNEIPADYVKINDYLYASHKPGYYSYGIHIDFISPYKKAKILYTIDCSEAQTYSSVFVEPMYLGEQLRSSPTETPLMYSVDAKLTWAGTNKNYHTNYVTNYQEKEYYPEIHKAYVFNVGVLLDGVFVSKTTQTYVISSKKYYKNYPILSLSMPYEDWFDETTDGTGTALYNNIRTEIKKRANLEFFDTTGESFAVNTQVKLGGGWSLGWAQRTLNLNFAKDENGEKQKVKFEIFGENATAEDGSILDTFKRMRLHNAGSCHDGANNSAIINDILVQELCNGVTNVSTTDYRPAIVYLNGEYWGYYFIREHYSDVYYDYNYDVDNDYVEYIDYVGGYTIGDAKDEEAALAHTAQMDAYLTQNNFAIDSVYENFINTYIDVDSYIDLLLIEGYIDNWDFMANGNNFRFWRSNVIDSTNPYMDGKYRFSLHDLDMGLNDNYYANNRFAPLSTPFLTTRPEHSYQKYKMTKKLLENEQFRIKLYNRLDYIANTVFSEERVKEFSDVMYAELSDLWADSASRWAWTMNLNSIGSRIVRIKDFFKNRYSYFSSSLAKILGMLPESEDDNEGTDFICNQLFEGNGSQTAYKIEKNTHGFTSNDFRMTYTHINNGIGSISTQFQYHVKFVYENSSGGESNYVLRVLKNFESIAWFDKLDNSIQGNGVVYSGNSLLNLGAHKYVFEKRGTQMTVYIDDELALTQTVPSENVKRIEFYQHSSNGKYRNLHFTNY